MKAVYELDVYNLAEELSDMVGLISMNGRKRQSERWGIR